MPYIYQQQQQYSSKNAKGGLNALLSPFADAKVVIFIEFGVCGFLLT